MSSIKLKSEVCCGEFCPHAWKPGVCRNCLASEAEHQLFQLEERLSVPNPANPSSTRERVIAEIVSSEQTYVASLQNLIKFYIIPLKTSSAANAAASSSSCVDDKSSASPSSSCSLSSSSASSSSSSSSSSASPLLTAAEATTLFSNVEVIAGLNANFLSDLKERVGSGGSGSGSVDQSKVCVGDLFMKFAPYFKMYTEYVTNYDRVTKQLAVLAKRSKITAFLQAKDQASGTSLLSLLILPIQRIPRYSLLLKELQKRTDSSHPDSLNIDRALELVEQVASFINEAVRVRENNEKVLEIQQLFVQSPEAKFVEPGRCFCRQGLLTKVGSKKDEQYDFFLFTDILVYASKRVVDGKLLVERRLNLDETFQIQNIPPGIQAGFSISQQHQFVVISGVKSFAVYCSSENEKQDWLVDIQEAMEEMKAKRQTYGSRAQILIPRGPSNFQRSTTCNKCLLAFNLINRRHHCRACNGTFCSICSSFSAEVSGFDGYVRVCESCFQSSAPTTTVKKRSPLRFVEERLGALTAPSIPCMGGLLTVANLLQEARQETEDVMFSMASTIDFATQMDGPRVKRLVQAMQDVQMCAKNTRSKANKQYIVRVHLPAESGQSGLGVRACSEDLLWRVKQYITEKIRVKNKNFPESQTCYHLENFDGSVVEETLTLRDIKGKEAGVRELSLVQGWEPSPLQRLLADASPCLTAACFKLYLKMLPEPLIPFALYQPMIDLFRQTAALEGEQRALSLVPVLRRLEPSHEKSVRAVCELLAGNKQPNTQMVYAFGPIFMRPREKNLREATLTDVQEAMANAKLVLELVQCLVTYWAEVSKQLDFQPLLQPLGMSLSRTATTAFALSSLSSSPGRESSFSSTGENFPPSLPPFSSSSSAPSSPLISAPKAPPLPPPPPLPRALDTEEDREKRELDKRRIEQQKQEEKQQKREAWLKEDERRNQEAQKMQAQLRKQDAEIQATLAQSPCVSCGETFTTLTLGKCKGCQTGIDERLLRQSETEDKNESKRNSNGSTTRGSVKPLPRKKESILESMSDVLSKHGTMSRIGTRWGPVLSSPKSAARDLDTRTTRANDWALLAVQQMIGVIKEIGKINSTKCHETTFGELMLRYETISDTLLTTLQRAKKHALVIYEGDLLEGAHDSVTISLTQAAEALSFEVT